jgi:thiol-disulfide isomerase/thioredoxin
VSEKDAEQTEAEAKEEAEDNALLDEPEQVDEAANAVKEELEGEGQERLVGIMYSEKQWTVPEWMKVAFLLSAFAMIAGLVIFSVDKRVTMIQLQMDAVVEPTPVFNRSAPDFILAKGDSGESFKLSDQKGKWVFINFWATWCPPCRDEMPSMEMLNRRFKDDMLMVAVSVDEDWNEVNRFFGETPPTFTVLWDKRKATSLRYGTRKFPETYLVSPEGKIAAKYIGPRDWYNVGSVDYFSAVLKGQRDPV